MINPGSEEGEHETMSSKSGEKSVRDRETPSNSKGEEEGTTKARGGNKDSAPKTWRRPWFSTISIRVCRNFKTGTGLTGHTTLYGRTLNSSWRFREKTAELTD